MNQKIENSNRESTDLSLPELLLKLKQSWRWLIAGAALGLVGGAIFLLGVDDQYEASAVIQPATVGISFATNTTTKGADVESAGQTLERLKLSGFYNEEILSVCNVSGAGSTRQVLAKKIKPMLIKGNALVQISYLADSPELAEKCLATVINQLSMAQTLIAEPIIKTLEEQRILTKQQLVDAEKIQAKIESRAMTLDPSDAKFSSYMLMLGATLSKREEIARLRKVYTEQTLLLSEPMTQSVKLLEPIYVTESPVYPKKMLVMLVGLTLGVLVGALACYVIRRRNGFDRNILTQ